MLSQVVEVQRQKLSACMSCPLCNKLFRDATTISECLHTFCRKCIYQKINDEEFDSCPVCNICLGCAPVEKLRADNSLEDLKTKIFPSKRQKAKSPAKAVPLVKSVPLSGRRKERSLSSLVVNSPKVPAKPIVPRKRLKAIARKIPALRESISIDEEPVKKVDDCHERLSSPETLIKIARAKRQNSTPDTSKQHKTNKDTDDSTEPCEGKADLWKPLTCLVEVVSRSKTNKSNLQETPVEPMRQPDPAENEAQVPKSTAKEHGNKSKVNGDENNSAPSPSGSIKTGKLQGVQKKGAAFSEGLNITAQAVVDSSSKCDARFSPVWFSLIASNDQEGDAPLPQISSCYLRIKDSSLPVSTIKRYIVRKLGLTSEAEVEISLQGQPVASTLQLHHLVDWWLQMAPTSERIQTTVGSSAKDFVMVLSYGRKSQPS